RARARARLSVIRVRPLGRASGIGCFRARARFRPFCLPRASVIPPATVMAQTDTLLRYRPWRGTPHGPLYASVAMAAASLKLLLPRRLMWGLFGLALLVFFFFFYAQYLVVWITNQLATETVRFAGIPVSANNLARFLKRLALDGSDHTFGNFIWYQGYVLVIV